MEARRSEENTFLIFRVGSMLQANETVTKTGCEGGPRKRRPRGNGGSRRSRRKSMIAFSVK